MRVFKWDPSFCPSRESLTAPIWIRLEGLPLYLFDEASLLAIANAIGTPLRVDPMNIKRVKLNSARVCVELNVAGPLFDSIWVAFADDVSKNPLEGFWVKVYYDVIPPFCTFCSHIGHHLRACKRRSGKQVDVAKVFDKLSQPGNSTVDKVLDGSPHPGESSKVVSGFWKATGNTRQPGVSSTASGEVVISEQQLSTRMDVVEGATEQYNVAGVVDLQQGSGLNPQQGAIMQQDGQAQVSPCASGVEQAQADPFQAPHCLISATVCERSFLKDDNDIPGQRLVQEISAAKVFENLPQPSSHSDPVLASVDSAGTCNSNANMHSSHSGLVVEGTYLEDGVICSIVADLEQAARCEADFLGGQHGGEVVIDGGVGTVDPSDIQTSDPQFHTPNLKRVEVPKLLGKSANNGIMQGKYMGSDLIGCKQKDKERVTEMRGQGLPFDG
ncbi:hypothetical protein LIER_28652 [Lithospermum erythrorhizon]|uniref:DUF4283 domain-containing protein n=1 Tax=Lithospermum erythrorhizon TaxID=34254 RepID=A0AAV3RI32_LITER